VIGNGERVFWPAMLAAMWLLAWITHNGPLLVALGFWTAALGLVWIGQQTGDGYRFITQARLFVAVAVAIVVCELAGWPDQ
jgi:hypothetical protein